MEYLENQRKKLLKKYLEDTEESIIKKETVRLFPNLMIGYRMFETEKERILIKRRAAFIKNLAKINASTIAVPSAVLFVNESQPI